MSARATPVQSWSDTTRDPRGRLISSSVWPATEGDATPRRWVYTAARIEGTVLVLWALRRGRGGG
ncbi:hypothetical protein EI982_04100 [Haloplanus rallus]|uniref:Uncharacterized protein n=1 Tax=Haloplanus rallus TaxID=1816183 RepID=A0A6B9F1I8_9EURY|nr:hypothetical protein EI982_04100 [Haloplanus rallus]